MAVVHTPVEKFTGTVVGVEFVDGAGETDDDNLLAYFRRHGYTIADKPKRAATKKSTPAKADGE